MYEQRQQNYDNLDMFQIQLAMASQITDCQPGLRKYKGYQGCEVDDEQEAAALLRRWNWAVLLH